MTVTLPPAIGVNVASSVIVPDTEAADSISIDTVLPVKGGQRRWDVA